jgi:hypothetical protein
MRMLCILLTCGRRETQRALYTATSLDKSKTAEPRASRFRGLWLRGGDTTRGQRGFPSPFGFEWPETGARAGDGRAGLPGACPQAKLRGCRFLGRIARDPAICGRVLRAAQSVSNARLRRPAEPRLASLFRELSRGVSGSKWPRTPKRSPAGWTSPTKMMTTPVR